MSLEQWIYSWADRSLSACTNEQDKTFEAVLLISWLQLKWGISVVPNDFQLVLNESPQSTNTVITEQAVQEENTTCTQEKRAVST